MDTLLEKSATKLFENYNFKNIIIVNILYVIIGIFTTHIVTIVLNITPGSGADKILFIFKCLFLIFAFLYFFNKKNRRSLILMMIILSYIALFMTLSFEGSISSYINALINSNIIEHSNEYFVIVILILSNGMLYIELIN